MTKKNYINWYNWEIKNFDVNKLCKLIHLTKRCWLDAWVKLNKKILSTNLMKVCETTYTKVKKDHLLEWKIILWRIQVCKINSDGRPQQEIK